MVSNMATTHCLPVTNSGSQGNVKGRRTRSSRINSIDSEPFTNVALKHTTCPGTPSTDSFGSKVSTSTPASSASLNENVSRNHPKPQVIAQIVKIIFSNIKMFLCCKCLSYLKKTFTLNSSLYIITKEGPKPIIVSS